MYIGIWLLLIVGLIAKNLTVKSIIYLALGVSCLNLLLIAGLEQHVNWTYQIVASVIGTALLSGWLWLVHYASDTLVLFLVTLIGGSLLVGVLENYAIHLVTSS